VSLSEKKFFGQDGALPHTVNAVLDVLKKDFDDRLLSSRLPLPPYSRDPNPSDYSLWGFLEDSLPKHPHTIKEMRQEILAAMIGGSEETLATGVRNFRRRLQMIIDADDVRTENVLI
jgi:hypothetical protein